MLDESMNCPVLDGLEGLDPKKHVEALHHILFDRVPDAGPTREAVGRWVSRSLGDAVFEFCKGPRRGAKLRVTWFYGRPPRHKQTIICVSAFKKRDQTPKHEKALAVETRRRYLVAPDSVKVFDLEDL